MTAPRPRLRGRSHQLAGIISLPVAITAMLRAPAVEVRLAVAAFATLWISVRYRRQRAG